MKAFFLGIASALVAVATAVYAPEHVAPADPPESISDGTRRLEGEKQEWHGLGGFGGLGDIGGLGGLGGIGDLGGIGGLGVGGLGGGGLGIGGFWPGGGGAGGGGGGGGAGGGGFGGGGAGGAGGGGGGGGGFRALRGLSDEALADDAEKIGDDEAVYARGRVATGDRGDSSKISRHFTLGVGVACPTRTSLSKVPEASVDTVGMGVAAPVVMAVLALMVVAVVAAVEAAVVAPLVDMEVLVVPVEPYEDSKEMKHWQALDRIISAKVLDNALYL
ncbi:hypothetical protein JM16_005463 [Phytophthora kernoviae]|uniref:RxLR effector protein n=1 Tax=Phytophthora kernoviae TaxID=325452 RepID=A0A8T0LM99_9STRA|nr:hypothetical protein JM16_005463 [Phytophthora kernoviae]